MEQREESSSSDGGDNGASLRRILQALARQGPAVRAPLQGEPGPSRRAEQARVVERSSVFQIPASQDVFGTSQEDSLSVPFHIPMSSSHVTSTTFTTTTTPTTQPFSPCPSSSDQGAHVPLAIITMPTFEPSLSRVASPSHPTRPTSVPPFSVPEDQPPLTPPAATSPTIASLFFGSLSPLRPSTSSDCATSTFPPPVLPTYESPPPPSLTLPGALPTTTTITSIPASSRLSSPSDSPSLRHVPSPRPSHDQHEEPSFSGSQLLPVEFVDSVLSHLRHDQEGQGGAFQRVPIGHLEGPTSAFEHESSERAPPQERGGPSEGFHEREEALPIVLPRQLIPTPRRAPYQEGIGPREGSLGREEVRSPRVLPRQLIPAPGRAPAHGRNQRVPPLSESSQSEDELAMLRARTRRGQAEEPAHQAVPHVKLTNVVHEEFSNQGVPGTESASSSGEPYVVPGGARIIRSSKGREGVVPLMSSRRLRSIKHMEAMKQKRESLSAQQMVTVSSSSVEEEGHSGGAGEEGHSDTDGEEERPEEGQPEAGEEGPSRDAAQERPVEGAGEGERQAGGSGTIYRREHLTTAEAQSLSELAGSPAYSLASVSTTTATEVAVNRFQGPLPLRLVALTSGSGSGDYDTSSSSDYPPSLSESSACLSLTVSSSSGSSSGTLQSVEVCSSSTHELTSSSAGTQSDENVMATKRSGDSTALQLYSQSGGLLQKTSASLTYGTTSTQPDVPLAYDSPSSVDAGHSSRGVETAGETTPHRPILSPDRRLESTSALRSLSPTLIADSQEELANEVPRWCRTIEAGEEGDHRDSTFKRPLASPEEQTPQSKRRHIETAPASPSGSRPITESEVSSSSVGDIPLVIALPTTSHHTPSTQSSSTPHTSSTQSSSTPCTSSTQSSTSHSSGTQSSSTPHTSGTQSSSTPHTSGTQSSSTPHTSGTQSSSTPQTSDTQSSSTHHTSDTQSGSSLHTSSTWTATSGQTAGSNSSSTHSVSETPSVPTPSAPTSSSQHLSNHSNRSEKNVLFGRSVDESGSCDGGDTRTIENSTGSGESSVSLFYTAQTKTDQLLSGPIIGRTDQLLSGPIIGRTDQLLSGPIIGRTDQLLSGSIIGRTDQLLSGPIIGRTDRSAFPDTGQDASCGPEQIPSDTGGCEQVATSDTDGCRQIESDTVLSSCRMETEGNRSFVSVCEATDSLSGRVTDAVPQGSGCSRPPASTEESVVELGYGATREHTRDGSHVDNTHNGLLGMAPVEHVDTIMQRPCSVDREIPTKTLDPPNVQLDKEGFEMDTDGERGEMKCTNVMESESTQSFVLQLSQVSPANVQSHQCTPQTACHSQLSEHALANSNQGPSQDGLVEDNYKCDGVSHSDRGMSHTGIEGPHVRSLDSSVTGVLANQQNLIRSVPLYESLCEDLCDSEGVQSEFADYPQQQKMCSLSTANGSERESGTLQEKPADLHERTADTHDRTADPHERAADPHERAADPHERAADSLATVQEKVDSHGSSQDTVPVHEETAENSQTDGSESTFHFQLPWKGLLNTVASRDNSGLSSSLRPTTATESRQVDALSVGAHSTRSRQSTLAHRTQSLVLAPDTTAQDTRVTAGTWAVPVEDKGVRPGTPTILERSAYTTPPAVRSLATLFMGNQSKSHFELGIGVTHEEDSVHGEEEFGIIPKITVSHLDDSQQSSGSPVCPGDDLIGDQGRGRPSPSVTGGSSTAARRPSPSSTLFAKIATTPAQSAARPKPCSEESSQQDPFEFRTEDEECRTVCPSRPSHALIRSTRFSSTPVTRFDGCQAESILSSDEGCGNQEEPNGCKTYDDEEAPIPESNRRDHVHTPEVSVEAACPAEAEMGGSIMQTTAAADLSHEVQPDGRCGTPVDVDGCGVGGLERDPTVPGGASLISSVPLISSTPLFTYTTPQGTSIPAPISLPSLSTPCGVPSHNASLFSQKHYVLPSVPLSLSSPSVPLSLSSSVFTSPRAALPCFHAEEGVGRVELRHVRTVKMVVERRVVSSELFEGGQLIGTKMWEEGGDPKTLEETAFVQVHQLDVPGVAMTSGAQMIPPSAQGTTFGAQMMMPGALVAPCGAQMMSANAQLAQLGAQMMMAGPQVTPLVGQVMPTSLCCASLQNPGSVQLFSAPPPFPPFSMMSPPVSASTFHPFSMTTMAQSNVTIPPLTCSTQAAVSNAGQSDPGPSTPVVSCHEPDSLLTESQIQASSYSLTEQPSFAFTPSPSTSSTSPGVANASLDYQAGSQEDSNGKEGMSRKRKPLRHQKAVSMVGGVQMRSMKRYGNEDLDTPAAKRQNTLSRKSLLFHGLSFYLTMRKRGDKHGGSGAGSDVDKTKMAADIESRGGRVMDDCSEDDVDTDHSYLLSDDYCRTYKYLVALATGIPCVSYDWIIECTKKEHLVNYQPYLLPSGYSLETHSTLKLMPRRSGTLGKVRVYIAGKKQFKTFWTPVLSKAGATVAARVTCQDADAYRANIILAEPKDSQRLDDLAARSGMTIQNTEWFVQCLINGYLLPINKQYTA